jgi:site-specific DNA recombinase
MDAGIYARLSRFKATERLTEAAMERQEGDCRDLCARRGWTIVRVYPDEGVSAFQKGRKRRGFEQAMADLEVGVIDVLVVWKLDRLVRRLRDWVRVEEVVERSGGKVVSVNEGEQSQLTLRILASMGEQESKNTSERVKRQQEQAAARGGPPPGGKRLLGYGPRRETIIEPEAAFVREAARRLLAGQSLRSVTAWANTTGVTSTTGRDWSLRTLRETLMSPGLVGRRVYRGVDFAEGRWTPILDRATHEMLVALLNDPARRHNPGRGQTHLLSGLVFCGREGCGAQMVTHYEPKARGGRRRYWCPANRGLGRPGCGSTTVSAEGLEAVVSAMVLKRLAGPGLAKALAAEDNDPGAADELRAAEARRDDIERLYDSGQIQTDAFLRMHGPAVERVDKARARLQAQASRSVLWSLPRVADELEAWWAKASVEQRRAVIQAVMSKVLVGPALKGSKVFDPARLKPPLGVQWRG